MSTINKRAVNSRILYENLDTSFVNLWALLRYLIQRGMVGRVHVQLEDYTADVFLTGSSTPMVHEIDHATGRESLEEAALHRLVVRAREPGGAITVYEGADEAQAGNISTGGVARVDLRRGGQGLPARAELAAAQGQPRLQPARAADEPPPSGTPMAPS